MITKETRSVDELSRALKDTQLMLHRLVASLEKKSDITPQDSVRIQGAKRILQKHTTISDCLR